MVWGLAMRLDRLTRAIERRGGRNSYSRYVSGVGRTRYMYAPRDPVTSGARCVHTRVCLRDRGRGKCATVLAGSLCHGRDPHA